MLIGISGQIFFSKKIFPIFLVSMGWEGVEINARFLFIQGGSEKRGTIRLCPCLEGVCQLCRQFFQCGSPPDNSLPNPFFKIYCCYFQKGIFQGSKFNWGRQVSPHDWHELFALWSTNGSGSSPRLNTKVMVSSAWQKDLVPPPTWIWMRKISHFSEQYFSKLCHFW